MSQDRVQLEDVFWQILREFEELALRQYRAHVPSLATAEKVALVQELSVRAPDARALEASTLVGPVRQLLADAARPDARETLFVQGLILENLAQAIYGAVDQNARVSEESRRLAAMGLGASASVTTQVPALLTEGAGDGDVLFNELAEASHDILARLDALGTGVDRLFGDAFALYFKDIAGAFVARLIPVCTGMGMVRRKVVSHLAGALMGL